MTSAVFSDDHPGGTLLPRLIDFVIACRAAEPDGEYPHVGDLQWWFRDADLEDEQHWRFWSDTHGTTIAVACALDSIQCLIHPQARNSSLEQEVRDWTIRHLETQARLDNVSAYTLDDEVSSDDHEKLTLLTQQGFERGDWYYLRFARDLDAPIGAPYLPDGYGIRGVRGINEVVERASLHRDSFYPYTSKTIEEAVALYRRCMHMPGYDPALDLVVETPDGTLAAGCICWLDRTNHVGLFEPVGTHPAYRRQGLATALMIAGMRRLQDCGATHVIVSANHPGTSTAIPPAFTSSRFVFESVGFRQLRSVHRYIKSCHLD